MSRHYPKKDAKSPGKHAVLAYADGGMVPLPQRRPRFTEFRRSDNVEDRRDGDDSGPVPSEHGYHSEDNDGPNIAGSKLSAEAGYDSIPTNVRRRTMDVHHQALTEQIHQLHNMSGKDYGAIHEYAKKRAKERDESENS